MRIRLGASMNGRGIVIGSLVIASAVLARVMRAADAPTDRECLPMADASQRQRYRAGVSVLGWRGRLFWLLSGSACGPA